MELISVIVPIYNTEKFLPECITSIRNQTYSNIEIILVDDGSRDRSLSICLHYRDADPRIKVISKPNSGVSEARNCGIESASGDYIAFVDSDDMIKSDMLEILHQKMKTFPVDLVACSFEYDYGGRRILKLARLPSGFYQSGDLKDSLIDDGTLSGILFGSVCTCLYQKRVIDAHQIRFAPTVKFNEDGVFNLSYLYYSTSVYVLSESLYIYRNYKNSTTHCYQKDRFTKADLAIKALYGAEKSMNYLGQMYARKVSVGFWDILATCTKSNVEPFKCKINRVREICTDPEVIQGLKYINYDKINKYKKIYAYLIRHQKIRIIYFLTRYMQPLLGKVIKR